MNMHRTTQMPMKVARGQKRHARTQFAALCYRVVKDKPQILMITSRDTRRWIIPKGWPMDGMTPAQAAAEEAWEEAGVKGRIHPTVQGMFSYDKVLPGDGSVPCVVSVFALRVKSRAADFPEKGERKVKWMSRKKAAARVREPELAQIIRKFDPSLLHW